MNSEQAQEQTPPAPTIVTITKESLLEMFSKAKAVGDFTLAQFEREKTDRICALCEALKALTERGNAVPTTYRLNSERQEIMEQLKKACESQFQERGGYFEK